MRRNAFLSRTGLIVRVDIPAGAVVASFIPEVSPCGKQLIYSYHMDQSRHDPGHTLGPKLCQSHEIVLAMEKSLTQSWSHIKKKCDLTMEGGDVKNYRRHTINLPEQCEKEFRDPLGHWELNIMGYKGSINQCRVTRSVYYYVFLFTEESKNATPARACINNVLHMDEAGDDNPMHAVNLARDSYKNQSYV